MPTTSRDEMLVISRFPVPSAVQAPINRGEPTLRGPQVPGRMQKKMENKMRMFVAAALMLAASGAMADEIGDAHKQAITGRDSYWNCLAFACSGRPRLVLPRAWVARRRTSCWNSGAIIRS